MKKIKWFFEHHEYWIFGVAIILFVALALGNFLFGWETFKLTDVQKLCWGIITVSVIGTVTWVWMQFFPYRDHIDPEHANGFENEFELTSWQKVQVKMFKVFIAFLFFALLFWAGIYSATNL